MFTPTLYQGTLGNYNLRELAETGVLTTKVEFSVDSDLRETKAHVSAEALDQVVQTRTITRGLIIDFEGQVITTNGALTGLAKAWAGQNIAVCAHFAAASEDGAVPAMNRLGYTRDPAKLLQVQDPTLALSAEDPGAVKFQMKYRPYIDHDAAAAA